MNETASPRDVWTAAQCRLSRRLFEICGAAGATTPTAGLAVALTEAAGQFAWHQQLYDDVLPRRVGIDRAALVAKPVVGADDALTLLEQTLGDADGRPGCALLALVVLPHLLADVQHHAAVTSPVLDGPRVRILTLVGRDLEELGAKFRDVAARCFGPQEWNDERDVLGRGARCFADASAV